MSDYVVSPIKKVLSVRIYLLKKKLVIFRGHQLKKTSCIIFLQQKLISRGASNPRCLKVLKVVGYDHLEDLAFCKWSSGGTGLLQMVIPHPRHPNHLSQDRDSISRTFLEQFAHVEFPSRATFDIRRSKHREVAKGVSNKLLCSLECFKILSLVWW